MDPLWILLIGMFVVVGGVLWLRLHAFLALIAGALTVAVITPTGAVERFLLEESAGRIVSVDREARTIAIRPARGQSLRDGSVLLVYPSRGAHGNDPRGQISVHFSDGAWQARFDDVSDMDAYQAGDLVVEPTAARSAAARSSQHIARRVASEFGDTCAGIGIMIALAAIIGDCLLASGAADRIVRTALKIVGEPRAPLAFLSSGYLLGIPVFFDTVFYLLIPLGKAMRMRTGRNYLLYVLTIVAGGTMTHSLVPPTPGPMAVAEELGIDMGLMIVGGMTVGVFTATFGYLYAVWVDARHDLPLRESGDTSLDELEQLVRRDERELPSTFLSLLPILLPVLLIAGNTVTDSLFADRGSDLAPWQIQLRDTMAFLGDKNLALVIAAAIAILMLSWHKRASRDEVSRTVGAALASGAVVILITAAGGAFGGMLRESGIGSRIKELALNYEITGIGILALAFSVTTLIRTAQGSATVAMITAAGILGDTFAAEELGFHPLYLALVIGCGSKPFSWMNDSGFWVICKMSGMTERETLRFLTPMTAAMGFIGCAVTMIGAWLWPLV